MAITATLLTAGSDATNAASYVTASITPTADRLVLAAVQNSSTGVDETPTLIGNGLTWVQVATAADSGDNTRVTVFRALGAVPVAGTVAISFGVDGQVRCGWSIAEFAAVDTTGTNGSGAVVQSKTAGGTGTSGTADFDAAFGDAVNNATYSAVSHFNNALTTPEAGFTELSDEIVEALSCLQVMWRVGEDQTPAPAWTGSVAWAQVVIEIKTGIAAQTLTGALFQKAPTFFTGTLNNSSTVVASGGTVTVTTGGTVTITGPGGVVYSGGSAVIILPAGSYTWTSTDSASGSFTVTGGGAANRMGGSGAIRKPPRNVGR